MKINSNNMNFKNVNELAYFTADATIRMQFEKNKSFPDDWDYVISESEVRQIPQKNIRNQILNNIDHFNHLVIEMIQRRLDWLFAEGFLVREDCGYRFLSDQEIEAELDNILSE